MLLSYCMMIFALKPFTTFSVLCDYVTIMCDIILYSIAQVQNKDEIQNENK